MKFIDFIKKYTNISNKFIDDFYEIFNDDIEIYNNSFIINSEILIKWLNIKQRENFINTIENSYILDKDYIIEYPNKNTKGGGNKKIYYLTTKAAKKYCLMTKSDKGNEVRNYFINIEEVLYKFKDYIIKGLYDKIKKLENNQKPFINPKKGIIYVFKAMDNKNDDITLYKIGRTFNLKKRLQNYNAGLSDNLELVLIYEADNIIQLEKCIKISMKEAQYRKYKEIYEVNIDIIKEVINNCNSNIIQVKNRKTNKEIKGGANILKIKKSDKLFLSIEKNELT
jgi:phage anti-repressor protein